MTPYQPDHQQLIDTAKAQMPYGKYKGRYLSELPEPYLVWMSQQGFPEGKLGQMLALVHEMKVNGLEHLLRRIRNQF